MEQGAEALNTNVVRARAALERGQDQREAQV